MPGCCKTLLRCPEPRARAAATRVLCHWRDRVDGPLELLRVQVADEHPRVRLEAVRAASFFEGPQVARRLGSGNGIAPVPVGRLSEIHARRDDENARFAGRSPEAVAGRFCPARRGWGAERARPVLTRGCGAYRRAHLWHRGAVARGRGGQSHFCSEDSAKIGTVPCQARRRRQPQDRQSCQRRENGPRPKPATDPPAGDFRRWRPWLAVDCGERFDADFRPRILAGGIYL